MNQEYIQSTLINNHQIIYEQLLSISAFIGAIILFLTVIFYLIIAYLYRVNKQVDKRISSLESATKNFTSSIDNISQIVDSSKNENFNMIEFPKNLNDKLMDFMRAVVTSSKRTYDIISVEQRESIDHIKKMMTTFEDTIVTRTEELKMYKDGYDYLKFKSMIDEILDLLSSLQKYYLILEKNGDTESLETIKAVEDKLIIILSNNNVEPYSIDIGTSIDNNVECEVIETKKTEDKAKRNTVEKTINYGYKVRLQDNLTKIIKKATVSVYS